MENEYIILVDESGQPYIAHWGIQKGGQRANHKYIMRITSGNGYRYFYTPEEVRAYQQGISRGARRAAENVSNKAKGIASRTSNRAKSAVQNTGNAINQTRSKVGKTAKYVKNEFRQAHEANKGKKPTLTITTTTTDKNGNKNVKTGKEAVKEAGRLIKEQVKSDINEKYGHKIRNAQKDINDAKNSVKDAANKVKSTSDRMKEEFRKNKEAASDKVKSAVDNVKDEVSRVSKNVSYDLARKDPKFKSVSDALKKAQDEYNNATIKGGNGSAIAEAAERKLKDAKKQYQDLLNKYDTSSIGNKAKDAVKSASDNVQNKVTDRVNQAKETYKKASDNVKNMAGAAERKAFDAAWDKVMKAEPGSEAQSRALDAFEKARNAYLKTPMGKADYGTERAKEILSGADGTPKEIAKDLADKAKDKISDATDKAKDKVKEVTGIKAKEELEKLQKEYDEASKKSKELKEKYDADYKEYKSFEDKMFEKYGVNYTDKMTKSELSKYNNLSDKEYSSRLDFHEIDDQLHNSTRQYMGTLKDKLDAAKRKTNRR